MMSITSAYKLVLAVWILTVVSDISNATESIPSDQSSETVTTVENDKALLDELMAVVDDATNIATSTRMNADYVPGTVSVLQGDELEALGNRTVWDALALVPGIYTSRGRGGQPIVQVRGINFPFSSGNVKILVNSIDMSRESSGANASILFFPIEQVKRIEVVRGPGAVLYGDNAFMGLINIITHKQGQRLYSRVEGNGAVSGGGRFSFQDDQNNLRLSANAYGFSNDSADAPRRASAKEDRQFGVFSLGYKGFDLSAQVGYRDYQENRLRSRDRNEVFTAKQQFSILPSLNSNFYISYLRNDFDVEATRFEGDQIEGGMELNWTGLRDHDWLFRFSYTDSNIDQASQIVTRPPNIPGQPPRPRPPANPNRPPPLLTPNPGTVNPPQPTEISNINRRYFGISLQDRYEFNDNFAITAGLRFDYREDLDVHRFSPRVAAVWQFAEGHILKAQYAEGFRAPTFFELFPASGKPNLQLETIATTEVSYIYRKPKMTGRLTLFHSRLDDMIFPEAGTFGNSVEAESRGVELEWEQKITPALKWQANLSYVDSWTTRTPSGRNAEDPTSTDWLGNIALLYRPIDNILLSAHLYYVGKRNSTIVDVDDEKRLAISLSAFDLFVKGLDMRIGIRNALEQSEQSVRQVPTGQTNLDFQDDSIVWAQFSFTL